MTRKDKDPYRLYFHLQPPAGWLNDPNGLCQFQGEYHVFFQYTPQDAKGRGKRSWGHYISKDLINWEFVGTALEPDEAFDRDGVYSGSALVHQTPQGPEMVLYYTGNVEDEADPLKIYEGRQGNTVRVSSTDGRTFSAKEKVLGNEDYPAHFTCHVRDPKVWEQDGRYYMVLGGRRDFYAMLQGISKWEERKNITSRPEFVSDTSSGDTGAILLLASEDGRNWTVKKEISSMQEFGYMWECPDYFRLPQVSVLSMSPQGIEAREYQFQNKYQSGYCVLHQDPAHTAAAELELGDFKEWDMGFDFYAPQTFEDEQGRRILMGWAGMPDEEYDNEPTVEQGWQHCLTMMREIIWEDGCLKQKPLEEYRTLRGDAEEYGSDHKSVDRPLELFQSRSEKSDGTRGAWEWEMTELMDKPFSWQLMQGKSGICLSYEEGIFCMEFVGPKANEIGRGRKQRLAKINRLDQVQIYLDTSVIEVYLNGGQTVFTSRFYMEGEATAFSHLGSGRVVCWPLRALVVK